MISYGANEKEAMGGWLSPERSPGCRHGLGSPLFQTMAQALPRALTFGENTYSPP